MKFVLIAVILAGLAAPVLAQEVTVPNVTTASPGGYANPLKLDTDRYKDEKGEAKPTRAPAPFGRCKWEPLTEEASLEMRAHYWQIARTASHHDGYRWLEEQCDATNAIQLQRRFRRGGDTG